MKELSAKMEGMGKADKLGLLSKIFGSAASSGMLAIMEAAVDTSDKGLSALEKALYGCSGAAKEMADRMNATAKGAMLRLESASEGLRIVIGNHLLPVYTKAIDLMAQFKSWLTQLIESHPVLAKTITLTTAGLLGFAGAALLVVGSLASIGGMIKMFPMLKIMAVSALTSIRSQAKLALASFSKLSVPIVGLIALAGALYYAWRKNLFGIRDMVTAVAEGFKMALHASVDGIAEVDDELANKLKAAGIWDFAVTMGQVFFRVRQFWNGLVEGFKEGLDFLKGGFDWLKGIFSPVVESGQELLKFLGILKPATQTQVSTWKAWGQLLGRIAVGFLSLIAAFKSIKIITGIFVTLGKAIGLIANPIGLTIVAIIALVAAGIYVYNHWEEFSEWFAGLWEDIAGYAQAAADWVKEKWQVVSDWWDSWTIDDVFAVVKGYISRAGAYVKQKINNLKAWWDSWELKDVFAPVAAWASRVKDNVSRKWQEFSKWWDSWTLGDVWQGVKDSLNNAIVYLKQKWEEFKEWLSKKFSNLNPFNWELPSWLGGGTIASNTQQVKNAENAGVYMPPEIPQTIQNAQPQPATTKDDSAKGLEDYYKRVGASHRVPYNLPKTQQPTVNQQPNLRQIIQMPKADISPKINVAPADPVVNVSQNVPALQSPVVTVVQKDNALADIEKLLASSAGSDVKPFAVPEQAPSSPVLIQHTQNQAAMNGQATVQAQAQAPERPVNVNNNVDVKIESKPAQVILDGEKVGSFSFRWFERQNLRNGVSAF